MEIMRLGEPLAISRCWGDAVGRSIVWMAFGTLPAHSSPKECGVMAVDVGDLLWVVGNGFDEAEQQVD